MQYETINPEDLSGTKAVQQGAYDAVRDTTKYLVLGVIAITAARLFLGKESLKRMKRKYL